MKIKVEVGDLLLSIDEQNVFRVTQGHELLQEAHFDNYMDAFAKLTKFTLYEEMCLLFEIQTQADEDAALDKMIHAIKNA